MNVAGAVATTAVRDAANRDVFVDRVQRLSGVRLEVIEAIEETNPDCTVRHLPGLVRIKCLGKIVITRDSVEEKLGHDWETHEFQMAIVSYFGHIKAWDDDEIVIAWDH